MQSACKAQKCTRGWFPTSRMDMTRRCCFCNKNSEMRPVSDYTRLAGHVMDHRALNVYESDWLLSNTGHVQTETSITQVTFTPPSFATPALHLSPWSSTIYQGTQEMESAKGIHHQQFYMALIIVY